jgi:phytol kinase
MHPDLIPAAIICLAIGIILGTAECWRIFGSPSNEQTRKLAHAGCGALCLTFAYIFESHWTVLGLAVFFAGLTLLCKRRGILPSVFGVKRKSQGPIYLPIAIYLCFLIAEIAHAPHFYFLAILVLSLSDAAAALVGTAYGNHKLRSSERATKSAEGSAAFFVCTMVILGVGLPLLAGMPLVAGLTVAALTAAALTWIEFISSHGRDNLYVPIGCMALLLVV